MCVLNVNDLNCRKQGRSLLGVNNFQTDKTNKCSRAISCCMKDLVSGETVEVKHEKLASSNLIRVKQALTKRRPLRNFFNGGNLTLTKMNLFGTKFSYFLLFFELLQTFVSDGLIKCVKKKRFSSRVWAMKKSTMFHAFFPLGRNFERSRQYLAETHPSLNTM